MMRTKSVSANVKRRVAIIHWYRAKNVWTVRFSDHCEHFAWLVINVPLETRVSTKSPKAYLKGRIRLIRHGKWAEVV